MRRPTCHLNDLLLGLLVLLGLAVLLSQGSQAESDKPNGFILKKLKIDRDEIFGGGPGRDGIPSIDEPKFVSADKVDFLDDDDSVIGIEAGGKARAYPLRILVWHEIVNDTIAGRPVLVTYCPLCSTAMVFDRKVEGKARSFGVSGLLYRSDVLMYDRESESLWSQLMMEAVSGPASGTRLKWLKSDRMSWKAWKGKHPEGEVLSTETGHERRYEASPYSSYLTSPDLMFPVPMKRKDLSPKDQVVGVVVDGQAFAFDLKKLMEKSPVGLKVGEVEVRVSYGKDSDLVTITREDGREAPNVRVFWFAWQAFYPGTGLWSP